MLGRPETPRDLRSQVGKGGRPAFIAVVLLIVVGTAASAPFATTGNALNVLRQVAPLGVLALGQTIVLLAGGIDLSVGMLIGLAVPLGALTMAGNDAQVVPAILVMLGLGLAVGIVNGVLVAWAGAHPFVLTFGMMALLQGVTFLLTNYRTVGKTAPSFAAFFTAEFGLPGAAWVLTVLALATGFVLRYTRLGRYLLATGSHAEYARRAGIRVKRTTLIAYVLSGLFAGFGAVLVLARLQAGYPLAGSGFELQAIVAAILGGAAFSGGQGSVFGALAGALVLALVANLLNLLGVSAYLQQVVMGGIIVGVVGLRAATGRRRFLVHSWTNAKAP